MLLSELLSRPAINLETGDFEGIVKNISFSQDLGRAEWLFLFDEDSENEDAAVPAADVQSAHDAVVIRTNERYLDEKHIPVVTPIYSRVYDKNGALAGAVRDIEMSEAFAVNFLILDTGLKLTPGDVLISGRYTVILSENVKKTKSRKKNIKRKTSKEVVSEIDALLDKEIRNAEESGVWSLEFGVEGELGTGSEEIGNKETKIPLNGGVDASSRQSAGLLEVAVGNPSERRDADGAVDDVISAEDISHPVGSAATPQEGNDLMIAALPEASRNDTPNTLNPEPYSLKPIDERHPAHASNFLEVNLVSDSDEEVNYQSFVKKAKPLHIPERIIADFAFLLGRVVFKDIYSAAGELIIPKNTVISIETVETARDYSRLYELTVNAYI